MATLRILLLTFTSRFVIDFLSIRKVIIFSAIATDDCHPPAVTFYTPKCCKLHDDSFALYCATEGGVRKPTAHAHVMMFDALPVGQTPCRVRRQWSR